MLISESVSVVVTVVMVTDGKMPTGKVRRDTSLTARLKSYRYEEGPKQEKDSNLPVGVCCFYGSQVTYMKIQDSQYTCLIRVRTHYIL